MNSAEHFVPLPEVARRLSCTVRTVWRMIAKRELPPPVKIGKRAALPASEVEAYMARVMEARFRTPGGTTQ